MSCRSGHQLDHYQRSAGVEDGVLDSTEWLLWYVQPTHHRDFAHMITFWQRRKSNCENRFGLGWAVKLRGALYKMNLSLSSLRLSMRGVDLLIDDSTLLFFLPQVKAGALANHLPQLCVRCGCIDPCKTHLQNTVGTLQWGAHSMQMQCSGWRTDLRGMDNTTQFKQGRVSVSVTAWPACTVSVYLGRRRKWKTSFKLCQMFREWASCLVWTVRMFLI